MKWEIANERTKEHDEGRQRERAKEEERERESVHARRKESSRMNLCKIIKLKRQLCVCVCTVCNNKEDTLEKTGGRFASCALKLQTWGTYIREFIALTAINKIYGIL